MGYRDTDYPEFEDFLPLMSGPMHGEPADADSSSAWQGLPLFRAEQLHALDAGRDDESPVRLEYDRFSPGWRRRGC